MSLLGSLDLRVDRMSSLETGCRDRCTPNDRTRLTGWPEPWYWSSLPL